MRVPVRPWHLALLPAVLAANYLFMTARHEAAHGIVVLAFGGEIADVHVWPPRAGTLSWITFRFPLSAPPVAVALQAAAPYVVALALLATGVWAVCRRLAGGIVRANVAVTAVLFPCCEIGTTLVGYWHGGSDLFYVFGPATPALRWGVSALGGGLGAGALGLTLRRICRDDMPGGRPHG